MVHLQAALGQDAIVIGQDGFEVTSIQNSISLSLPCGSAVYRGHLALAVAPGGVLGYSILDQMLIGIEIEHTDARKAAYCRGDVLLSLQICVMLVRWGCPNALFQRRSTQHKVLPFTVLLLVSCCAYAIKLQLLGEYSMHAETWAVQVCVEYTKAITDLAVKIDAKLCHEQGQSRGYLQKQLLTRMMVRSQTRQLRLPECFVMQLHIKV